MSEWKTKIFGDNEGYNAFIAAMRQTAEETDLPAAINMEHPEAFTLEDVRQLMLAVKKDIGLAVDANYYLCDKCDSLHLMLIVDLPIENDQPRLRLVK